MKGGRGGRRGQSRDVINTGLKGRHKQVFQMRHMTPVEVGVGEEGSQVHLFIALSLMTLNRHCLYGPFMSGLD